MEITITITETTPGVLNTKLGGRGVCTELESRMIRHVATAIDKALNDFDKTEGIVGGGSLTMLERKVTGD